MEPGRNDRHVAGAGSRAGLAGAELRGLLLAMGAACGLDAGGDAAEGVIRGGMGEALPEPSALASAKSGLAMLPVVAERDCTSGICGAAFSTASSWRSGP